MFKRYVRSSKLQRQTAPHNTTDNCETAVVKTVVHRTLNDSARFKRNVIISGLPEVHIEQDRSDCLHLCDEHLTVKPHITESGCVRIGKVTPNKPRRLLVRLNTEEAAEALLRDVPKLCLSNSQFIANNVYINPDLSPATAKLTARN